MYVLDSHHRSALCRDLHGWIDEVARLTRPQIVHWCTGTDAERSRLSDLMMRSGALLSLNPETNPHSFLAQTQTQRIEQTRRMLCCRTESSAGPNNSWADPAYMQSVVTEMLTDSMIGRVLYVIPYLLGIPGSPRCEAGVQLTDSPLVALVTSVMARVGRAAMQQIQATGEFVRGIHSLGSVDGEQRLMCHFPEDDGIVSYGTSFLPDSVFAMNAHGLRLSGIHARRTGWFAEHMAVLKVTSPDGAATYIAVCGSEGTGKTTLSLLLPPDVDSAAGWKLESVSDDLTWLNWDPAGTLRAFNPLTGRCGTVANTNSHTSLQLQASLRKNALFTNVGLTASRAAWWDDADGPVPLVCTDWSGRQWTPQSAHSVAHPEARYVIGNDQCAPQDPQGQSANGVPISAILFCTRRSQTIPLVREAESWPQAVWMGATLKSERAATSLDRSQCNASYDPFGQRLDCGYHLADHWQHWLNQARRPGVELPRVFEANWFQRDQHGRYRWPGYRENFRVLKWIVERTRGRGDSQRTVIGTLPTAASLGLTGSAWTRETVRALLDVDDEAWSRELEEHEEFLARFSTKLPPELLAENDALRKRIWHGRDQQRDVSRGHSK